MPTARMATLQNIERLRLPVLTKAFVFILAASYVQERLITEVCAQESWDFEYGYKHVDQDNAEDNLFETSNTSHTIGMRNNALIFISGNKATTRSIESNVI